MTQQTTTQLMMLKLDIRNLPEICVPQGYSLRSYKEGDGSSWENVIDDSFGGEKHDFDKSMAQSPEFQAERIFFICHQGIPVATASAWHSPEKGLRTGSLHMVGALTAHSGHGLGYWASLAALRRMCEEGRTRAVLRTDDFRKPAIKTYLKLGFVPLCLDESHEGRWKAIFKEMHLESMVEKPLLNLAECNPFTEELQINARSVASHRDGTRPASAGPRA